MTWQKKSPLFIEEILEWADAYRERTGDWPIAGHGEPVYEAPEENWRNIDVALRTGRRSLPAGSSVPRLLDKYRGRRNLSDLPDYRLHDILAWADAHFKRTGQWPLLDSGPVLDAPGETWEAVHAALSNGLRSLPGGSSLARLLALHRGVRNRRDLPPLSIEQILEWADAFHNRYDQWPTTHTGGIEGEPWETWWNCDYCLWHGARGLPGGSSLARLLRERRGPRRKPRTPALTEELILQWAEAHHAKTGCWPQWRTGPVIDVPDETWVRIDRALKKGNRSLPGRSSLAKLLRDRRSVRMRSRPPDLSEAQILEWADAHRARVGQWPTASAGRIFEAPEETWSAVNTALRAGRRGLPGGGSLSQLLDRERGIRNIQSLRHYQIDQILEWADAHYSRTGQWPRKSSGTIAEAPEETWARVDNALLKGSRGLPGGSSLARLLAEYRGVRNRNALQPLNEDDIVRWILAYRERAGKWPTSKSGSVEDAPGETWGAVSEALRDGGRGMPGGTTLTQLIRDRCASKVGG